MEAVKIILAVGAHQLTYLRGRGTIVNYLKEGHKVYIEDYRTLIFTTMFKLKYSRLF